MAAVVSQAEVAPPRPAARLCWFGFAVAAVLAEIFVIYVIASIGNVGERLVPYLLLAAHLLLVPFLIRNRSFWGMRLVLLGLALNVAVMAANGGLMPVDDAAVTAVGRHEAGQLTVGSHIPRTKNVLLDRDDMRLADLSDAIILPVPRPFTRAMSVGDLFIGVGLVLTGGELIVRRWVNATGRRELTEEGHRAVANPA